MRSQETPDSNRKDYAADSQGVVIMEEMLSVEDLARQFNVSPRTVVRLVEKREIRALRVGRQWRFRKEWVDEWINKNVSNPREDVG